ncbi:putative Late nodulin [Medicago truncatula]|uniref:Nodule Cysteine-Rich (NCR) secreted peptide n=1 Tax=Medicago truncatula TaxID=3880 RepID=A0A072UUK9_MEDTR|nr:Nodule Cysteine-Rich (NCR) secreted peptide [Medicago truncatula]RHN60236.1 putative Late nodulin [Medicago truncatula]
MAEILKFVNVLILLIFIFLVIVACDSSIIFLPCITDKDCPDDKKIKGRCRKGFCTNGWLG